jgi:uncharacterized protein (TIRG00374 family)
MSKLAFKRLGSDARLPFAGNGDTPSERKRKSPWRVRLVLACKVGVAAGLLTWLIGSGKLHLEHLLEVPRTFDLVVLLGLVLASMVLPVWRWWWLLRIQQFQVPFRRVLALSWVSSFSANILPGVASGDMVKGYLILRGRTQGRARAFSTVLADRALGVYSQVLMGSVASLWFIFSAAASVPVWAMAATSIVLLLGMTVAGCLLLFRRSRALLLRVFRPSWGQALDRSFESYRQNTQGILGCFALSLLSSGVTFITFGIAAGLLGQPVSWEACFLAGPLVVLANCLPLTPGGIGVGETVSYSLYRMFGMTAGGEMAALVRVCGVLYSLPGAFGLVVSSTTPDCNLPSRVSPKPKIRCQLGAAVAPKDTRCEIEEKKKC